MSLKFYNQTPIKVTTKMKQKEYQSKILCKHIIYLLNSYKNFVQVSFFFYLGNLVKIN